MYSTSFSNRDEYLQERRGRHGTNSRRQRPRNRYTEIEFSLGMVNPMLAAAEKRAPEAVQAEHVWLCEVGEVVQIELDHVRTATVIDRAIVFGQAMYRLELHGGKRVMLNAAQMSTWLVRPVVQQAVIVIDEYEVMQTLKRGPGRGLWHSSAPYLELVK